MRKCILWEGTNEKTRITYTRWKFGKLRTAVLYGADAIYIGALGLSLRAEQAELNLADLEIGIREAHQKNVKVYAAMNVFAKNKDLVFVEQSIRSMVDIGIDGVILAIRVF